MIHELAHTVHFAANYVVPGFDVSVKKAYDNAQAQRLYQKDLYIMFNRKEYFVSECYLQNYRYKKLYLYDVRTCPHSSGEGRHIYLLMDKLTLKGSSVVQVYIMKCNSSH